MEDYIDRICIIDDNGYATHKDIENVIFTIDNLKTTSLDIETLFYNNTSSSVYNTFIAILNGTKYINTSIFGLGKQNGITDLSGMISRLYPRHPEYLQSFNLNILILIYRFIAPKINRHLPINNPIIEMNLNLNNKCPDLTDYDLFKNFIKHFLPNIYTNLEENYIRKLFLKINQDISNNSVLHFFLSNDIQFTINYILKHVC